MGPEHCRHAQVKAVTPKRKAPPQHGQGPVTLSQLQHLDRKKGETPSAQVAEKHDNAAYTAEQHMVKTGAWGTGAPQTCSGSTASAGAQLRAD